MSRLKKRRNRKKATLQFELDSDILRSAAVEWLTCKARLIPIGWPAITYHEQRRNWEILIPDIGAIPASLDDAEAQTIVNAPATMAYILQTPNQEYSLVVSAGDTEDDAVRNCQDKLIKTIAQEMGAAWMMAMYAHYLEHGPGSLKEFS